MILVAHFILHRQEEEEHPFSRIHLWLLSQTEEPEDGATNDFPPFEEESQQQQKNPFKNKSAKLGNNEESKEDEKDFDDDGNDDDDKDDFDDFDDGEEETVDIEAGMRSVEVSDNEDEEEEEGREEEDEEEERQRERREILV